MNKTARIKTRKSQNCPPFCKYEDCIDVYNTITIDGKKIKCWLTRCKTLKGIERQVMGARA